MDHAQQLLPQVAIKPSGASSDNSPASTFIPTLPMPLAVDQVRAGCAIKAISVALKDNIAFVND